MVPAFLYSLYLTLYKTDTSLRQTLRAGPKGVRLRESWLYLRLTINDYDDDDEDNDNDEDEDDDDNGDDDGDNDDGGGGGNGGINEDNYDNDDDNDKDRLFTFLYFFVIWSRSRALLYGLPSCMSVKTIWKSRCTPLMIRRAISRR